LSQKEGGMAEMVARLPLDPNNRVGIFAAPTNVLFERSELESFDRWLKWANYTHVSVRLLDY
jgi:hypothetical protein